MGKKIYAIGERPTEHKSGFAIMHFDTIADGPDTGRLIPCQKKLQSRHNPGEPLLRYPFGEGPLERGIMVFH